MYNKEDSHHTERNLIWLSCFRSCISYQAKRKDDASSNRRYVQWIASKLNIIYGSVPLSTSWFKDLMIFDIRWIMNFLLSNFIEFIKN